jgi:membrane glycosyltransferase
VDSSMQQADQPPVPTQEAVIARVTRDASRIYGDTIEEATLAAWAEVAVSDLWGESVKVTTFLPVLAMRQISLRAAELVRIKGA